MRGFNARLLSSPKVLLAAILLIVSILPLVWSWYSMAPLTTRRPPTVFAPQPSDVSSPSNIGLAARVNLRQAEAALDAAIPPVMADFSGERGGCIKEKVLGIKISIGCRWNGQVTKRGPLSLSGAGDALHLSIPAHAWVTGRNRSGPTVRQTVTADFTVTATARPKVDSNWNLDSNFDIGLRWDKKPTLRLFNLIEISVTSLVEPKVKEQLNAIESQLSEEVARLQLREKADKMWKLAHKPIHVSEEPNIWLRIAPQAVSFSGIHVRDDVLTLSLAMRSESATVLGEAPVVQSVSPLPPLGTHPVDKPGEFSLRLPVIVQYDVLRRAVETTLRAGEQWMPIDDSGVLLTVKQVEVYPSEPHLVVGLDFTADVPGEIFDTRGVVYFLGKLDIDNDNKIMRVEEFHFTAVTDNALANTVELVFGEALRKRIQDALVIDFRSDHERLLAHVDRELNRDFDGGVSIKGNVNSIGIGEVLLLQESITLIVSTEGALEIAYGL